MAETKSKILKSSDDDESVTMLNITDILGLCISNWFLFALTLAITLSAAYLFLRVTPPVYTRTTSIAIKVDANAQAIDNLFIDIKGANNRRTANMTLKNEIIALQQVALMQKVVERLDLDYEYTIDKRVLNYLAYGPTLPVKVELNGKGSETAAQFTLHYVDDETVEVYNKELWGKEQRFRGAFDTPITIPVGQVVVHKGEDFRSFKINDINVRHTSYAQAAYGFKAKLEVYNSDKESSVLNLSFTDINIQRADDILNTLIAIYNEEWIVNRNQVIVSTNRFIGERLNDLEKELREVESELTNFLIDNKSLDVTFDNNRFLSRLNQFENQNITFDNEKLMVRVFREYLEGVTDHNLALPLAAGINNGVLSGQVNQYNNMVLNRCNLISTTTEDNPIIVDLDRQMDVLKHSMLVTIDNHIKTMELQRDLLRANEARNDDKLEQAPELRRNYTEIERRYRIKEQLYTYLLRTREQNELQQAFDAYNTRILQPSTGSNRQSYPDREKIWLMALLVGLFAPFAFIVFRELTNSKVRGRRDLDRTTVPFVGELPLIEFRPANHYSFLYKIYCWILRKKVIDAEDVTSRGHGHNKVHVVVKEGNRNMVNEAFRVLRTNVEFLIGQNTGNKVIMTTSANPHSGKTFISYNLALCMALKGKKVCTLDLDLRRRSLSKYVPKTPRGISDYLNGLEPNWRDLVVVTEDTPNLHVLPVGTLPPNPAELLSYDRFGELIQQLRAEYDYVFFDCPPVEIVADTNIIALHTDVTLFAVRVGMMELEFLPVLESYYREQKFKNLGVILNGTLVANSRYGYRRYGYRYGYGYGYGYGGYGYGYGYNYSSVKD